MASILRFDNWQNSDGTSIATTDASGNISFAGAGAGKILQVVSTTKTDHFTTTGTGVDITGMSVTLTPSSIDSKVLILVMLSLGSQTSTGATIFLNRGGTNIAVGTGGSSINAPLFARFATYNTNIDDHSIVHLDSPATTSATTYKLVMNTEPPGSTIYVNRRYQDAVVGTVSSITALEVSA